jgi:drug/metabolite transporter (DMT)-like permease
MESSLWAVFYGLASALTWGAGDFSGGFATKRSSVIGVIVASQIVGVVMFTALALAMGEVIPSWAILGWAAVAGFAGAAGLVLLYRSLAHSRMGIAAPLSAVLTAALPVAVGVTRDGALTTRLAFGFALAFVAVWLISRGDAETRATWQELATPALAGLLFAAFLIIIDYTSETAIFWPLASARLSSLFSLSLLALLLRRGSRPHRSQLPLIALVGVLEGSGNAFYALAARSGRLDVAAVLASLYPAVTVLLAWFLLRERLSGRQWLGVGTALLSIVLIAT